MQFSLSAIQTAAWAPGQNTLGLSQRLQLDTEHRPADLTREIVLALLMGPVVVAFPGLAELVSAVRIRHNIVQAARKTTLAFHTSQAERPEDCWTYKEDCGFVILPACRCCQPWPRRPSPRCRARCMPSPVTAPPNT